MHGGRGGHRYKSESHSPRPAKRFDPVTRTSVLLWTAPLNVLTATKDLFAAWRARASRHWPRPLVRKLLVHACGVLVVPVAIHEFHCGPP
jgi:hypothetical protein